MNRKAQSKSEFAHKVEGELAAMDRILASEDSLLPSSGFVAAVMERVREEAAAPAPIPLPWKRILPGVVVMIAALGFCVFELGQSLVSAANNLPVEAPVVYGGNLQTFTTAGSIALALLAPLLSWLLARRLIGGSRLL
jgi:hypothetical protein